MCGLVFLWKSNKPISCCTSQSNIAERKTSWYFCLRPNWRNTLKSNHIKMSCLKIRLIANHWFKWYQQWRECRWHRMLSLYSIVLHNCLSAIHSVLARVHGDISQILSLITVNLRGDGWCANRERGGHWV